MANVKIGLAPTRRNLFSTETAEKFAADTERRLQELGVDYCSIADITTDGLLREDKDLPAIAAKFKREKIKGLFVPHVNFGTEYEVARLAKELGVPLLLWGPRDECPDENGIRLRDSQCGLFATGKVLRRFNVPFTYFGNCRLTDPEFERGIKIFQSVCNTVSVFKSTRILQLGPRPYDFFSTMCNEGELLEKFGIQLAPVSLKELTDAVKNKTSNRKLITDYVAFIKDKYDVRVDDEIVYKIAALKSAIGELAAAYGCNAAAIQCWNSLQTELGIMPCAANSLLCDEGFPVACETDIHGAVTAVLVEAAAMNESRSILADWTVRHPTDENGELLQHCGCWPASCAAARPGIGYSLAFTAPGAVEMKAAPGQLTISRFDGDNGKYSLLLGRAKVIDGPYTKGSYVWIKVKNLLKLEAKLVEGPYIHHCAGIYADVVPPLYEACKYIGLQPDLFDCDEEAVRAFIRGEKNEYFES